MIKVFFHTNGFLYFDWVIPDGVHGAYQRKIDYIENRLDIMVSMTPSAKLTQSGSFEQISISVS